ncbi:hypothetical protein AWB67_06896 [Caballeronia terrestris]|uniref:Uncharacterized protein n=2 Tax=Caballeronia TaxID=1827195 RepID=A0A158KXX1_9BURK|nr:hypothetical protein AWB65_06680 [Caballeronia humi]SAL85261.1 hypothetical protein AWB67_06896 [Caballeronia terrestris]
MPNNPRVVVDYRGYCLWIDQLNGNDRLNDRNFRMRRSDNVNDFLIIEYSRADCSFP